MTSDKIKDILDGLGYKLTDKGRYWQTNAVFRDGDNHTALQIWKDTGVWRDYVSDGGYSHFRKLLEHHFSESAKINKLLEDEAFRYIEKDSSTIIETLQSEKIYDEKILDNLLPHYKFYNDRGISDATLQFFKGGLATQGKMYQRFVFPIYSEYGQIHGFGGRDMLNKEGRPKWKHIGQKRNWFYPLYINKEGSLPVLEAIKEDKMVILVESIGDALNLYEHGILNSMISFGLDLSSSQCCHLVGLGVKKIVISFNNDAGQVENRGAVGAIKSYLKLLDYFDPHKLLVCLPIKNDFGDMTAEDFSQWRKKFIEIDDKKLVGQLIAAAHSLYQKKSLSKVLYKNTGILEDYYQSL